MKIELPKWYDLHAHFRQGDIMPHLIRDHLAMGCAGILAMPNTVPPVAKVLKANKPDCWSIEEYLEMLNAAGADAFDEVIVPMYLTKDISTAMIELGVKSGLLRACKYYPPHGTTGAQSGAPLETYIDNGVFRAMEENDVILCVHGEEHDIRTEDYFSRATNAEEHFYRERLPRVAQQFPDIKIVCEHVTTKVAVDFVKGASENIAATVTPQHLLYTVGHLVRGLNYHLYCLPLLKFEEDRQALRDAVTSDKNTKFFAGTDSAPHVEKFTECGCAAGCYTGGIAPQLYAQVFEEAGVDMGSEKGVAAFKAFLCTNGPAFYGLDVPEETFTLEKSGQSVEILKTGKNTIVPLPFSLEKSTEKPVQLSWKII